MTLVLYTMSRLLLVNPRMVLLLLQLWVALLCSLVRAQWIDYPDNGIATMTHYQLPLDYVAACGCSPNSTQYPTVALSQMAYGSSMAYGPGCGRCFKLTLLNTFTSDPPFYPNVTKSVVVKVTDLCPLGSIWCSATNSKPNAAGVDLNFDLAYPSIAIPDDFFPSNVTEYGYTDFGVWNISYSSVSCETWEGYKNSVALGAVDYLGDSVCCPANPSGNSTCPSYSEENGIPPEASPGDSSSVGTAPVPLKELLCVLASLYVLLRM